MNKEFAIQLCNAVNAEMAKGKSYDEAWQLANSGTSEGVRKSWEKRARLLSDKANAHGMAALIALHSKQKQHVSDHHIQEASDAANQLSKLADETGSEKHHFMAENAHGDVAKAIKTHHEVHGSAFLGEDSRYVHHSNKREHHHSEQNTYGKGVDVAKEKSFANVGVRE